MIGRVRAREGDSCAIDRVHARTKVFTNIAAPPLARDGQLPAQVARVLKLPPPRQDGGLEHRPNPKSPRPAPDSTENSRARASPRPPSRAAPCPTSFVRDLPLFQLPSRAPTLAPRAIDPDAPSRFCRKRVRLGELDAGLTTRLTKKFVHLAETDDPFAPISGWVRRRNTAPWNPRGTYPRAPPPCAPSPRSSRSTPRVWACRQTQTPFARSAT